MSTPVRIVKRTPASPCTRCRTQAAKPGHKRCVSCLDEGRAAHAERRRRDADRVPTFDQFCRLEDGE
jgi:hypothetical protein